MFEIRVEIKYNLKSIFKKKKKSYKHFVNLNLSLKYIADKQEYRDSVLETHFVTYGLTKSMSGVLFRYHLYQT